MNSIGTKNKSGFTLIELLVVISIIGLLTAMALVTMQTARAKSRDARRFEDMHTLQTVLEIYRNEAGGYPAAINFDGASQLKCGTNVLLNPVPKDPGLYDYGYNALGTPASSSCAGGGNIVPNYNITFTTEQQSNFGIPGTHTLDQGGIR